MSVLKLTTLLTNTLVNELHASGQRNGQHGSRYHAGHAAIHRSGDHRSDHDRTAGDRDLQWSRASMDRFIPSNSPTDQMEYGDQISWSHGKHTIRAGYEFQHAQWPITFAGPGARIPVLRNLCGLGTRSARLSSRRLQSGNPGNTNGGGGNILQCLFCVRSGPNGIVHNYQENNQTAFVQDDWKVNSRLTFNLGVRWEYDGSYSDKYGNLTNISLAQFATVPVPPTGPTTSGPGLVGYVVPNNYTNHYPAPPAGVLIVEPQPAQSHRALRMDNFAPRFGFAWQPQKDGKLVIRGGVGMFYDRIGGGTFVHGLEQGYPYAVTLDYSGSAAAPFSNANPYPSTPLGTFASRWVNFGGCQPSCLLARQIPPSTHPRSTGSSHAADPPVQRQPPVRICAGHGCWKRATWDPAPSTCWISIMPSTRHCSPAPPIRSTESP